MAAYVLVRMLTSNCEGNVFGFMRRKDDNFVLHQKLGRFLNGFQFGELDAERQRSESRTRLGMACLMFLFSEAENPKSYALGVTTDISLHGLGLVTNDSLEDSEYILVFGPPKNRMYVRASCKRYLGSDFGTNMAAFEFLRALKETDYPAIALAVTGFESRPEATATGRTQLQLTP